MSFSKRAGFLSLGPLVLTTILKTSVKESIDLLFLLTKSSTYFISSGETVHMKIVWWKLTNLRKSEINLIEERLSEGLRLVRSMCQLVWLVELAGRDVM